MNTAIPPAPPIQGHGLAQAIQCGSWPLAFSYRWARAVIEQFDMVPVPRAPGWLSGVTNIDSRIVPVIDLALFIDPEGAQASDPQHSQLLHGIQITDTGTASLAILFQGRPQQITTTDLLPVPENAPANLRAISAGRMSHASQQTCHLIRDDVIHDILASYLPTY